MLSGELCKTLCCQLEYGGVCFPVTLELSVLNTENKLFIYVIVS